MNESPSAEEGNVHLLSVNPQFSLSGKDGSMVSYTV